MTRLRVDWISANRRSISDNDFLKRHIDSAFCYVHEMETHEIFTERKYERNEFQFYIEILTISINKPAGIRNKDFQQLRVQIAKFI